MMLGDNHAMNLGIEVGKVRLVILLACALLTAAAVSFVGIIGFVGLVIPHVVRMITGPDHRILIPASILAGSLFLVVCDILSRLVYTFVLPIGILTALIGAPYFVYLLRRRRREIGW
jgi:iron complex transport system permease protein